MNPEEAKVVLLLYRPGVHEDHDPEMDAALGLTKQDPDVKRWFDRHCARQIKLRSEFNRIEVPEGLREQIISERPAPASSKATAKPRWLIGAAFALLVIVCTPLFRPQSNSSAGNLESYRHRMTGMVVRAYPQMDIYTNDVEVIRHYLSQQAAPTAFSLSDSLQKTPGTGGKVLSWQNHKVSMICFRSGKMRGADPDLFLFVIDQGAFERKNESSLPVLTRQGSLLSATWSDGNQTYILATTGDESFLKQYL